MFKDEIELYKSEIDGVGPWLRTKADTIGHDWIVRDWEIFKPIWKKYVTNYSVIIQAGGFQGLYPRLFSDYFDLVYTFEPTPISFFCLNYNCQKDNIIKLQASLGNKNKLIGIEQVSPYNRGMNMLAPGNTFPMLTIDSFGFLNCGMIQLDVEGSEILALKGGINTIKKYKPFIQVETNRTLPIEVLHVLKPLGYKIVEQFPEETFLAVE
jgi:FkbM family methyltransferase